MAQEFRVVAPDLPGQGFTTGATAEHASLEGMSKAVGALLRALGYRSRAEQHLLDTLMVKEAMVENPITATADLPLAEAARLMTRHQIGCLPVVDGERLVGILTESDFVRLVAG